MSFVKPNLRYLIRVTPRGETGIAEQVGLPITQPKISNAIHGNFHLRREEVRAIELKFGIPKDWMYEYPLEKMYSLLRKISDLCPDKSQLKVIHRLLKIALANAPSSK